MIILSNISFVLSSKIWRLTPLNNGFLNYRYENTNKKLVRQNKIKGPVKLGNNNNSPKRIAASDN